MHVPNTARRSVVFIGEINDSGAFRPRATGFFVAARQDDFWFPHLVTAEHVIAGLSERSKPVYHRINMRDGLVRVEPMSGARWCFHPDAVHEPTDVAVAPIHANWDSIDHECIPLPERIGPNPIVLGRQHIGLGDETFAIGLFRHHHGSERNIPIIRIGNVAALPEEQVYTKWGYMSAYLVEMRSIAGLSGSPVFVRLPNEPLPLGSFLPDTRIQRDYERIDWSQFRLLGLIHGHFDIQNLKEDSVVEDDDQAGETGINTGIGIVIPAEKIIETLYQPDLVSDRQKLAENWKRERAATPDES